MDTLFFCLAVGGATIVLIICGVRLMRRFLRLQRAKTFQEEDPNLYAVAMRAWETGKPIRGTVDEYGELHMEEIAMNAEPRIAHRRDCGMPDCFLCYGGK